MKKGEPKKGGRAKGTPNKKPAILREAILLAASQAGKGDIVAYLAQQAVLNPGPFMALLGKVLPTQIENGAGGAFVISWQPKGS